MESCNCPYRVQDWNLHVPEARRQWVSRWLCCPLHPCHCHQQNSAKLRTRTRTDQQRPARLVKSNGKRNAEVIVGKRAAGMEMFDADSVVVEVSAID